MAIYDPKSMKADEFINNEEIIETIAYAEANKDNIELIDELLAKAAPKKKRKRCNLHRPYAPRGGSPSRLYHSGKS